MKKILAILIFLSFIFSPNFVFSSNYLLTWKNYYKDSFVKKWFLDEVISEQNVLKENFDILKKSAEQNLIVWNDGMTFNEFYLANNISPEDNFYAWLNSWLVYLDDDKKIKINSNYNPRKAPFVTYVWPTNNDGWPYWSKNPTEITKPSFFSRLTVWDLQKWTFSVDGKNIQTPNENKSLLKFDRDWYVFPNMIWYGEYNTVNDYMLTAENDFSIPVRYNTVRDDVHLTFRSQWFWWFDNNDAQVFLEAKDGDENIVSKEENPKKYINTTTSIFITPVGFAQLGDDRLWWLIRGWKTIVKNGWYKDFSKKMENISVDNFVKNMNKWLKQIASYSATNSIASWNGWQIQMEWFFRDGDDTDFWIKEETRILNAKKTLDVKFFMYYNNLDSVNIRNATIPVKTPKASNGKNLYSPNESVFKIEITRPYFSDFWNLNDEIIFKENDFDAKIWEKSFKILDFGYTKNWEKIWIDKSRIKIRLSEDGLNFSPEKYSFEELKKELKKDENIWKTFKIAYTYAASDTNDENIWKLPAEILDNSWAYAIPFLRTIKIPSRIIIKYLDENLQEIKKSEEKTWKIWEKYEIEKEDIPWYEFLNAEWNLEWIFKGQEETVILKYKISQVENPVSPPNNPDTSVQEKGILKIKYLNIDWKEILPEEIKTWKIWENYNFEPINISNYEFFEIKNWDSKNGVYLKQEQTLTFIYKLKVDFWRPPVIPKIENDPRVSNYFQEKTETKEEEKIETKEEEEIETKEEEIETKEEEKTEIKEEETETKEEEKTETKDREEAEKIIKNIEKKSKKLPVTWPISQESIYKKWWISKSKNLSKIEIKLPNKSTFDLWNSGENNLNVWLTKLPEEDRKNSRYLVLPVQGLILPINTVSKNSKSYQNFIKWKEESFEEYLNKWTVELPISRRWFWQIWNKVIAWHSSYWKNSNVKYKTHFQKIIWLEKWEEIWVFEKNLKTWVFEKYIYKVTKSFNTDDEDISILNQNNFSELTLFTCTPIWGIDWRWVVKSKFLKKE